MREGFCYQTRPTLPGEVFEAVGIPPDIAVPVFSDADYDAGRDSAIEAARTFFAAP
ncbi:MAG: hypothetical protein AAGA23_05875 [Pseudomonadota bacterium]